MRKEKKTRPKQSSDWIIIMEPVNLLGKSEQNWIQSIWGNIFRPFTCNSSASHHPNINWSLSLTNNNNNASRCFGGDDIKMRRKNTHTHTKIQWIKVFRWVSLLRQRMLLVPNYCITYVPCLCVMRVDMLSWIESADIFHVFKWNETFHS